MVTRNVGVSKRDRAARTARRLECEEEISGLTSQLDANLGVASSNAAMAAFILGRQELMTLGEIIDAMLERLRRGDPRRGAIFIEVLSVLRRTSGEKRKRGTGGVAERRPGKGRRAQGPGAVNPRESTLAINAANLRETMNVPIAKRYVVVFEPDSRGWLARIPDLNGCHTWGPSIEEARKRIREALSLFDDEADQAELVEDVRAAAPEAT